MFSFVELSRILFDSAGSIFAHIMAMNWYLSVGSLRSVLVLTSKYLTFKWVLMQETWALSPGNTMLSAAVPLTITAGYPSGCCAINKREMDHSKLGLEVKWEQNSLKNHFWEWGALVFTHLEGKAARWLSQALVVWEMLGSELGQKFRSKESSWDVFPWQFICGLAANKQTYAGWGKRRFTVFVRKMIQ